MESPPKFLKENLGKPIFKTKRVVCVLEMGSGVYLRRGEGVRHPTTPVPKNGYPKLISQNKMAFKIILITPNDINRKVITKQKIKINERKKEKYIQGRT